MNTKCVAGIAILTIFLFMGCSGNYAHLRNLSDSESKAIQKKLLDNWPDYDIRYRSAVLFYSPKNDDRKVLLGGKRGWWWVTIKDQDSWTEFVNTNMTSQGDFRPPVAEYPMTGVREIWGPDNC